MAKFFIWLESDFLDETRRDIEYSVVKAPSLYFARLTFLDNNPSCTNEALVIDGFRDGRTAVTITPSEET